jgi:CheY-like chemotaxis protein
MRSTVPGTAPGTVPGPTHSIAVIEDNSDNLMLLQALLEEHFRIVPYTSGPEALEKMPTDGTSLALLDISLPGMDGVEVLRRIRQDPDLDGRPVIALTAHAMAGDRERYLAEGFDDYVSKPILDEDELIATIEHWLAKSPPESEPRSS